MALRTGPDLIETYEDDPGGPYCEHCGEELDREECDQCGGEGYFDGERLMEEDPLWYQPGDTERCEQCSGKGGWRLCRNRACPGKQDDS